jgi:FkbH-like protein
MELVRAAFDEILEMRRSVMQHDAVKIVIFDLDDTLWRGIAAEADDIDVNEMSEGWPRGLVEAASLLWRRGILVALCSKNDQETVERIWAKVYGKAFPIENFVVRKINWQKKADNIREILQMVNLLPESALFVDDNPAERSGVKEALPGIRVLEQPLVEWRRTLIWSAELQPVTVTGESADRTRTIKAQIERKEDSQNLSAEDHLRQLDVRITPTVITDPSGRVFERCFELINKTNQFNTTGRRWTLAEMIGFLKEGGTLISVEVEDRHASYGITGVAMVTGTRIEQLVLSCRVFGMGVEQAMLALCLRQIAAQRGETEVTGLWLDTGKNRLAHGIFAQVGMVQVENDVWRGQLAGVTDAACTIPAHVTLAA